MTQSLPLLSSTTNLLPPPLFTLQSAELMNPLIMGLFAHTLSHFHHPLASRSLFADSAKQWRESRRPLSSTRHCPRSPSSTLSCKLYVVMSRTVEKNLIPVQKNSMYKSKLKHKKKTKKVNQHHRQLLN